jgi:DNA-binding XRE family transcriptional regulator
VLQRLRRHGGNVTAVAQDLGVRPGNLYPKYPELARAGAELRGYTAARKLTDEQAAEYRRRAAAGEEQRQLAQEAGLSDASMSLLLHGRTYRNAGGPITPTDQSRAPLTDRERRMIRSCHEQGLNRREIAGLLGLHYTTICGVIRS